LVLFERLWIPTFAAPTLAFYSLSLMTEEEEEGDAPSIMRHDFSFAALNMRNPPNGLSGLVSHVSPRMHLDDIRGGSSSSHSIERRAQPPSDIGVVVSCVSHRCK
jgi:hypothetical protein